MKKIITIIATLLLSIMIVGVANAYVVSGEYVTHNDWRKMVASMSERLDYLSLDYIRELCNENDTIRHIKEETEKKHNGGE